MDAGAQEVLDGAYGAFDFADVAVGGNDVHFCWFDGVSDALEFAIGVHVLCAKGPVAVDLDRRQDAFKDSLVGCGRRWPRRYGNPSFGRWCAENRGLKRRRNRRTE